MMNLDYICVLLAVFMSVCFATNSDATTCSQQYQDALVQAINIKRSCETAELYDCCQVSLQYMQMG